MNTCNRCAGFIFFAVLFAWTSTQPSFADTPGEVVTRYLNVQSTLAQDSLKDVPVNARALAEAVRSDETKSLPTILADQADTLAKARNLAKARQSFKSLSASLIDYLKANSTPQGVYYEVYCPIAKASWLQSGETVKNPYLGPRSATPTWGWACAGEVKTKFENPSGKD